MSLDVYLEKAGVVRVGSGIFVREEGSTKEISREEWNEKFPDREPVLADMSDSNIVYHRNITHNVNTMASKANIYMQLWQPEEIGITKANQLIEPLEKGLELLESSPSYFKQYNPSNGWGSYEGLVAFVKDYLKACRENPDATVRASR